MKVLLIEDEVELAKSIVAYLSTNDCICEWVSTKAEACDKIVSYEYDCILLDLSLPDGNGFEVLKFLASEKKTEGVIIISARENLASKIEGIELGADDYLTKPFHLSELMVRIYALIRRKKFDGRNTIQFNELTIDVLSKTVQTNKSQLELTKSEFDLLLFLVGNENKVLSKSAIAEHLSGDMADMLDNHDFVYAHIKNLKKKIAKHKC